MKKLILTGCKRFNFESKLYEAKAADGKTQVIYEVDDKTATHLLDQFERETGYNYFEVYTGTEAGVAPGVAVEDERTTVAKGPKPKQNERFKNSERPVRGPRPQTADQSKPGRQSAPIEDADGIEV
jgi:hypothetical protein